jgi:hypothetical protein
MRIKQENISPNLASEILAKQAKNRTMRATHIKRLAGDMIAGRWEDNGETIKIDVEGKLIDGQHRLKAIIKSGVTLPLFVARDVPKGVIHTVDTGATRGVADALKIADYHAPTLLAAAARQVMRYHENGVVDPGRMPKAVSSSEAIAFIEAHPRINEGISLTYSERHFLSPAYFAALYAMIEESWEPKFFSFFDKAAKGVGIEEGCPTMYLRNDIIKMRERNEMRKTGQVFYVFIRYWNTFTKGTSLRNSFKSSAKSIKIVGESLALRQAINHRRKNLK